MSIDFAYIDDGLKNNLCCHGQECHEIVSLFRQQIASYRIKGHLFMGYTPSEIQSLPPSYLQSGITALAGIDLQRYNNLDQVLEEARTCTKKKGRVNREVNRAKKLGYYVKPFPFSLYVPDVYEIHQSKPIRNGRPLSGDYYLASIEDMGGFPETQQVCQAPNCPIHNWQYWGVFISDNGHYQGSVQVNEKLVGYVRLRQQGNSAWYDKILGHGDHLKDGIMYLLHYEIVRYILEEEKHFKPRYLVYHQYFTGGDIRLNNWKKKALFKPFYMVYVEDRPLILSGLSSLAKTQSDCLSITLSTVLKDLRSNQEYCEEKKLDFNLLSYWHRLWILDQTRHTSLLERYYNPSDALTLEGISSLKTDNFPITYFDLSYQSVIIYTESLNYGVEDLVYLNEMQLNSVIVGCGCYNQNYLENLKKLYDPNWIYESAHDLKQLINLFSKNRADMVVVNCNSNTAGEFIRDYLEWPWRSAQKVLLLSISAQTFQLFGIRNVFDVQSIISRLENLYGFSLDGCHWYFKDTGDNVSFWIMFTKKVIR